MHGSVILQIHEELGFSKGNMTSVYAKIIGADDELKNIANMLVVSLLLLKHLQLLELLEQ